MYITHMIPTYLLYICVIRVEEISETWQATELNSSDHTILQKLKSSGKY